MSKKNIKSKNIKNKNNSISNQQGIAPIWIILILIIFAGIGVAIVLNLDIIKDKKDEGPIVETNVNKSLTEQEKQEMIEKTFSPLSKAIMETKEKKGPDSDQDGLTDDKEKEIYKTDPNKADTDDDGLSDWQEIVVYKTNPLKADTDNDGTNDKQEIENNTNPTGEGQKNMNGTGSSPLGDVFTKK